MKKDCTETISNSDEAVQLLDEGFEMAENIEAANMELAVDNGASNKPIQEGVIRSHLAFCHTLLLVCQN